MAWTARWRVCDCQDGRCPEPAESQSSSPDSARSTSGTRAAVTCQPPFTEHTLGLWALDLVLDLPLPRPLPTTFPRLPAQLAPHWLCPEVKKQGH